MMKTASPSARQLLFYQRAGVAVQFGFDGFIHSHIYEKWTND